MTESQLLSDHEERFENAKISLQGLSVGDAFGNALEVTQRVGRRIHPWPYTDDTVMGVGVLTILARHGRIVQDELAAVFGEYYADEPNRGYGQMAHYILQEIHQGRPWREVAAEVYDGMGSMGNGAAMRVGPVGAYFADDPARIVEEARLSAEITHAHPEGQAGAIAVALAAGWALVHGHGKEAELGNKMLNHIVNLTPPSETRNKLEQAIDLPFSTTTPSALMTLGNGSTMLAQDTVPLALWLAARHLDHYENALREALSAGGDRDTNCAIVGSVVVLSSGYRSIPTQWLNSREPIG